MKLINQRTMKSSASARAEEALASRQSDASRARFHEERCQRIARTRSHVSSPRLHLLDRRSKVRTSNEPYSSVTSETTSWGEKDFEKLLHVTLPMILTNPRAKVA